MFEMLQDMHGDKLQQLENSDDICDELVEQLPPLKNLEAEIQKIDSLNTELAAEILSQEERLQELRDQVIKKTEEVENLQLKYEELSNEYQHRSDRFTPMCIKASLRDAACKSDQESERLAEQFLNGSVDADHFLEAFIAKRMLSHKRRIKEEKLHHQLQELERAGY